MSHTKNSDFTLRDNFHYYIDESGQIIKKGKPAIYGCPGCGACFVQSCFCGFTQKKEEFDKDELYDDEMYESAYEWNVKNNPSANY